jgi:prepilin peptidase CpaA
MLSTATALPWNLATDQWLALFVILVVIIVCAWIDFAQFRVPNNITLPTILLGWVYGFARGFLATPEGAAPEALVLWPFGYELVLSAPWAEAVYGFWCSFKLTFLGIGAPLLLLFYAIGGMGAGDVKMQMGFGAWMATIFGYEVGWVMVFFSFCFAAIVGGIIAIGMIWWYSSLAQNKENFKAILQDWMTSKSVKEIGDKAAERKKTLRLIPYGVPLCIGFISYLALDYYGVWAQLWSWTAR